MQCLGRDLNILDGVRLTKGINYVVYFILSGYFILPKVFPVLVLGHHRRRHPEIRIVLHTLK